MTPAEYDRAKLARRKAAGTCPRCGAEPKPGRIHCPDCLRKASQDVTRRRQNYRAMGRCMCGREVVLLDGKPMSQCARCRATTKRSRAKYETARRASPVPAVARG